MKVLSLMSLMSYLLVGVMSHGAAVIFSGNDVKTLKSNIDLNGNAKLLSGTVDPTSSATSAPKGSLYLNTSTGLLYVKNDAGSTTNWSPVRAGTVAVTSGGTGLTSASIGDMWYGSAANTHGTIVGNTSATAKYLRQVGSAGVPQAPAWTQVPFSELSGSVAASQMPALTGDVTTSAGAVATTLATVNSNVGSFGSGSLVPVITVNGKGLITAVSTSAVATSPQTSYDLQNVGLSVTVASNAVSVALKQSDGSTDCSSGTAACVISFRNGTATNGQWSQISTTGALSLSIPSGTTIGTANSGVYYIMVYAINNAGTAELAVAVATSYDEGSLWSTTAISGGATLGTLYSTTARTSKAIRLIGRFRITEATAGTWATAPTEVAVIPFKKCTAPTIQTLNSGTTYTTPTAPAIPAWLEIEMCGGGGGSSGGGTTGGGAGGAGGATTFGTSMFSAGGGGAGIFNGTGGAGGTNTITAPAIGISYPGNGGASGASQNVSNGTVVGAAGGGSPLFGGGAQGGAYTSAGIAGVTNSGGGASAPGDNNVTGGQSGSSGGSGGCIRGIWSGNIPATITYAIGAGGTAGTAGTSGLAGAAGGSGGIRVIERYACE